MLCIIIFLYLPYKISWSSSTNRSINHRLKYNYFVQSFTMSTEIFPRRSYRIKSVAFLSHLKSLSDVDEGGFWSPTRFYQFCMHSYTSTKTLYWYNMKNMIMLSITSRIFVNFSSYSQSSFIEEKSTQHTCKYHFCASTFQYFSTKIIWIFLFLGGGGGLSLNRHLNHDFKILSLDFQFILSWFLMFDLDWEIGWFCPSESQIRIRTTVLFTNLQRMIISKY